MLLRESIILCLQQHLYLRLLTTYRGGYDEVVVEEEDKIKRRMIRLSK